MQVKTTQILLLCLLGKLKNRAAQDFFKRLERDRNNAPALGQAVPGMPTAQLCDVAIYSQVSAQRVENTEAWMDVP